LSDFVVLLKDADASQVFATDVEAFERPCVGVQIQRQPETNPTRSVAAEER
jgi:hypothetical protein